MRAAQAGMSVAADNSAPLLPNAEPSLLGLARLGRALGPAPGTEALLRHLVRILELGPDRECLLVPCGGGQALRLLAQLSGAAGAGVDPDASLIEEASAAARQAGLGARLHFEASSLEELPYQDGIFDVTIGDLGLAAAEDPVSAIHELVRVTKPMGAVVLIQLSWSGEGGPADREVLADLVGASPLLLVEWKQALRDSGVVDLSVEDRSDAADLLYWPFNSGLAAKSLPLRDLSAMLLRGWLRWGWRPLRRLLAQEREIKKHARRERLFGTYVIRGVKWGDR